ncbi:Kinase [Hexamita inflata]|uniref:CAMK CAMKL n=1 Tax=Hexamita inflata TaxID=28002 RepID=A0AA86Q4D9_9EUKA|nr:CAMK CAMKL [Hexamita inflata]
MTNQMRIALLNGSIMLNEYTYLNQIGNGTQSKYILCEKQKERYAFQLLPKNQQSQNRILTLQKIHNIKHVIKLHELYETIIIDDSVDNQEILKLVNEKLIIAVYHYTPLSQISQTTFTNNPNPGYRILNDNQLKQCLNLFKRICETVKQLHDIGIYHFDLKPDNILASSNNFYIIDFGSCPQSTTQPQSIDCIYDSSIACVQCVTELMSPRKYDLYDGYFSCKEFDVFSLGCLLFYLLTNTFPTMSTESSARQYHQILKSYNTGLADLVRNATHRDLCLRYSLVEVIGHPSLDIQLDAEQSLFSISTKTFRTSYSQSFISNDSEQDNSGKLKLFHFKHQSELINKAAKRLPLRSQSQFKVKLLKNKYRLVDDHGFLGLQHQIRTGVLRYRQEIFVSTMMRRTIQHYDTHIDPNKADFHIWSSFYFRYPQIITLHLLQDIKALTYRPKFDDSDEELTIDDESSTVSLIDNSEPFRSKMEIPKLKEQKVKSLEEIEVKIFQDIDDFLSASVQVSSNSDVDEDSSYAM